MRDLSITIVEEHTKRLSRNLALTQTRRRTITFENPPANDVVEITKPNSNTTIIRNAKASKSICTTTTSEKSLRPAKNPITSTITTTTVDVPYKNFKIWTDYDQEENLQLHIREQKPIKEAASDCRKGVAMRTIWYWDEKEPRTSKEKGSKLIIDLNWIFFEKKTTHPEISNRFTFGLNKKHNWISSSSCFLFQDIL